MAKLDTSDMVLNIIKAIILIIVGFILIKGVIELL